MEHRPSASSKDNGGQFSGRLQMYGSTYQMQPIAESGFFSGSSSSNCPPASQAPAHKSEQGSTYLSDLSSYMESFAFVDGHGGMDSSRHVWACGSSPQMGRRLDAPQGMPPEAFLNVISNTQRKLQHLEVLARMMIRGSRHHGTQQQQALSMEFASVMSQLFSTTASFSLLSSFQAPSPPAQQVNDTFDFSFDGFNEDDLNNTLGGGSFYPPPTSAMDATNSEVCEGAGVHISSGMMDSSATKVGAPIASSNEAPNVFPSVDSHTNITESSLSRGTLIAASEIGKNCIVHDSEDQREEDDDGEGESLPPGSYDLVELAATEILAEHTHFCEICSKGFKRDANLRMHMRGHGDEYKTAAALARPDKTPRDASLKLRRYSCPYAGCKRNKKHPKFQPLKTMLCVKNHYRRSHCPKLLVCSRCKVKKFSVVADLKTHEKHCGQYKWQCSCGTTFSRKDKLYGHIGLFAGHTPATPAHEVESVSGFGDGLEGLASGKTANVNAMQENLAAKYGDVTQAINSYNASAMGITAKQDDGSVHEQRLKDRETSSFLSFNGDALIRESSLPSVASSGIVSDGLELQNLLSETDGLFQQGGGSN